MKSQLLGRAVSGIVAGPILVLAAAALGQTTNLINDGTTLANLALKQNQFGAGTPGATFLLALAGGELEVSQSPEYSDFPLNGVWYDNFVAPTTNTYVVLADARPAFADPEHIVGLMAWLDTAAGKGLAFRVVLRSAGYFQVATIDFAAATLDENDSVTNLYQLDGLPATADLGSAWAQVGAYDPSIPATFHFEVSPPTPAELVLVTNATARIAARVYQGEGVQVGDPIQLLTTLPMPVTHRFGYFASWGTVLLLGEPIGYLDNLRLVGDAKIENRPPSVAITSPTNGTRFTVPAAVTLAVEATDPEGRLARTDLYQGETLVATTNVSPANFTVSGLAAGSYTFKARAVDDVGATGESESVTIEMVIENRPPSVAITSPTNGTRFNVPAAVTLTVEATDPEGGLARTDLYQGDALVASTNVSPAHFTVSGLAAGIYTFKARAVDDVGAFGDSEPVTIEMLAPAQAPRLENPTALPSRTDFRDFKFTATGLGSGNYRIETTTNYVNWAVAGTGAITGATMEFTLPRTASGTSLVYRLVVLPSDPGGVTPARLASPLPSPSATDFQRFQFRAEAMTGDTYRLELSSDLRNWAPVETGSVTGAVKQFDLPRVVGAGVIFYRIVSLP